MPPSAIPWDSDSGSDKLDRTGPSGKRNGGSDQDQSILGLWSLSTLPFQSAERRYIAGTCMRQLSSATPITAVLPPFVRHKTAIGFTHRRAISGIISLASR